MNSEPLSTQPHRINYHSHLIFIIVYLVNKIKISLLVALFSPPKLHVKYRLLRLSEQFEFLLLFTGFWTKT